MTSRWPVSSGQPSPRVDLSLLSQTYKMAANFIMKTADRKQWSRGRHGGWRHNYQYQAETVRRDSDDWPQSRPQMFNFFPNSKIQFVNNVGLMNTVPLVDDSDWKQKNCATYFLAKTELQKAGKSRALPPVKEGLSSQLPCYDCALTRAEEISVIFFFRKYTRT